ncbi:hypothetical protein [Rhizobium tubonense]|uniref:hypothetical protein n=1 Tax=Rhizobium tubonense TaxID=484088 RepID=UPI0011B5F434|nr:hypothetical protein [Rhizobium tubonense]
MKKFVFLLFILFQSAPAFAEVKSISAVPTAWKLEDYMGGSVVLWFTPSECTSGQLLLPATASTEQRNRLWSTILSAKQTQKSVFVYYNSISSQCIISSYGAD